MTRTKEIFEILERKMEALDRLLCDLHGPDTGQQRDILSRIAVEGRAISNILQNLRDKNAIGKVEFDFWYDPFVAEMKADPLMRFFYELRTSTLKQGDDRAGGIQVSPQPGCGFSLSTQGIENYFLDAQGSNIVIFYPAPPNAIRAFVANNTGGAGWEIKQPDGSTKIIYAPLHPEAARVSVILRDPPKTHLGVDLPDASPTTLCTAYLNYLHNLVQEARIRFLGRDAQIPAAATPQ
jgi:hypothetical protein